MMKEDHLNLLLKAYFNSINNIKLVLNTKMAEIVPEVLEEEINLFKQNFLTDGQHLSLLSDLM